MPSLCLEDINDLLFKWAVEQKQEISIKSPHLVVHIVHWTIFIYPDWRSCQGGPTKFNQATRLVQQYGHVYTLMFDPPYKLQKLSAKTDAPKPGAHRIDARAPDLNKNRPKWTKYA